MSATDDNSDGDLIYSHDGYEPQSKPESRARGIAGSRFLRSKRNWYARERRPASPPAWDILVPTSPPDSRGVQVLASHCVCIAFATGDSISISHLDPKGKPAVAPSRPFSGAGGGNFEGRQDRRRVWVGRGGGVPHPQSGRLFFDQIRIGFVSLSYRFRIANWHRPIMKTITCSIE